MEKLNTSSDLINSNKASHNTVESRVEIDYPTRKPFKVYLEELSNPKIRNTRPVLVKREQAEYLNAPRIEENPYSFIKKERINQLKAREEQRKLEEKTRHENARNLSEKLPVSIRQRNTAASNVRNLIHEENVRELTKHGRLFGPNRLTAQPVNSKFTGLQENQTKIVTRQKHLSVKPLDAEEAMISVSEKQSSELESDSREQVSRSDGDLNSVRQPLGSIGETDTIEEAKQQQFYEGVKAFVNDRRRVCLFELAIRTKKGEIKRLDEILKAENDFLRNEEQELLRRHEEHDRYLKSICQRTAEAIKMAESEARKRIEVTERIKRARYRLAHLNAECVKLEEEYIRLNTYKDFLHKVADTFKEHHAQTGECNDLSDYDDKEATVMDVKTNPFEEDKQASFGSAETDEASLIEFFTNPQDLVDILSELESNNLTLIENVQEQEEVCERVRAKANKLYEALTDEREMVDEHIEREKQNIGGIKENVIGIGLAKDALSDYVLLERYAKVFYLGDMDQFESSDVVKNHLPTGKSIPTGLPRHQSKSDQESPDVKPRISNLLAILQTHIQRVYSAVYGTNEGGARLDTIVMLRRLETTVDELSEMLNAYPKNMVLKAKRTVDERNRQSARRRQKFEGRLAYERRLKKAIQKAREGPRWQFGRRVLQRSKPPQVMKAAHVGAVVTESDDENKSLFAP